MFSLFGKKYSVRSAALLSGATDAHSHILYGVDDGIGTLEESLATLEFYEKAGLRTLWLTPHIMEDVPNTTEALRARLEKLKASYKGNIELLLSAEYMLDNLFEERLSSGDLLTHGEGHILVETSTWAPPINLWGVLERIKAAGYRPILAHPERYRYMGMADYRKLRSLGIALQLNIPSIVGYYGESVRRKAQLLLRGGFYSMAGSDCHRRRNLASQCEAQVLKERDVRVLKALLKPSDDVQ